MTIPEKIIANHNLKPYHNNWMKGIIELPFGTFYHYFRCLGSCGHEPKDSLIFRFTIKNYDDTAVIDKLIASIEENVAKINPQILSIVKVKNLLNFDSLLFTPFAYTILPPSEDADFDAKQIQVIPIYNAEFSGDESPRECHYIFRKELIPPDWNRKPYKK